MPAQRRLLMCAMAAATLAMGCGASAAQSRSAASSALASQAGGAGVTATASPAGAASSEASGSTGGIPMVTRARVDQATSLVVVDVTVTGPADLLGGCQPTLSVHIVDPAGNRLAEPTPQGAVHCLAITAIPLATGQTRAFTASVGLPPAHGTYTVEGQINGAGAIPTVTIAA